VLNSPGFRLLAWGSSPNDSSIQKRRIAPLERRQIWHRRPPHSSSFAFRRGCPLAGAHSLAANEIFDQLIG
jgi:hypothetical protein